MQIFLTFNSARHHRSVHFGYHIMPLYIWLQKLTFEKFQKIKQWILAIAKYAFAPEWSSEALVQGESATINIM